MGALAKVVQPLVLSMLHVLHHLLLRRFVAFEFIRHDDAWHEALFFQQFAKESLCRLRIPMPLQQNFQHIPLRIYGSPQIVLLLLDCHDHFIQVPYITDERTFTTQLIGVLLFKFLAPLPNRFIRHLDAAIEHHFLNIPIAQGKGVIEPDTVTNNFAGESMTGVHKEQVALTVEPVRLFYIPVNLTIPIGDNGDTFGAYLLKVGMP